MKRRWRQLACLCGVLVCVARPAVAQTVGTPQSGTGVQEAEGTGVVAFPQDQIFPPIIADPKEPRSFVSLLSGAFPSIEKPTGKGTMIGSVGLGDSFGLVRWGGPRAGEGVQLDVVGSIFAQFDLNSASNDLINADYIIGLPLTIRRRGFGIRARIYHQSSHLGDEFLLRSSAIQRDNLSFESVELLASQEIGPLRLYGGGERIFRRDPDTVEPKLLHVGAEVRSGRTGPLQLLSGVDLKTTEQHNWSQALSGRVGFEVARTASGGHPVRFVTIMLELYKGPSPYGQFFQEDISYVGAGIHFSL
jgi:Protein of unknown function (DUF1207)